MYALLLLAIIFDEGQFATERGGVLESEGGDQNWVERELDKKANSAKQARKADTPVALILDLCLPKMNLHLLGAA